MLERIPSLSTEVFCTFQWFFVVGCGLKSSASPPMLSVQPQQQTFQAFISPALCVNHSGPPAPGRTV